MGLFTELLSSVFQLSIMGIDGKIVADSISQSLIELYSAGLTPEEFIKMYETSMYDVCSKQKDIRIIKNVDGPVFTS